MAKYFVTVSYTAEGAKGVLKEGGSKRRAVVEKTIEGLGGKLEAFYFVFGKADAIVIADLPDAATAAALSLAVAASGGARALTVPALTAAEFDAVTKKKVGYRAPGA